MSIMVQYPGGQEQRTADRAADGAYYDGPSSVAQGGTRYTVTPDTLTIDYAYGEGADTIQSGGDCRP